MCLPELINRELTSNVIPADDFNSLTVVEKMPIKSCLQKKKTMEQQLRQLKILIIILVPLKIPQFQSSFMYMLWFKFILGLMFFKLVSILLATMFQIMVMNT